MMDRMKIQELAATILALAANPKGVDQQAAMDIATAAQKIDAETRKKPFYPSVMIAGQ